MPNPIIRRLLGKKASVGPDPFPGLTYDGFEAYTVGATLHTLNKGWFWGGMFSDVNNFPAILAEDTLEGVADTTALNGVNSGLYWSGSYVDRDNYIHLHAQDSMQSYSDTTALNGLNGGLGAWGGAYVDH